MLFVTKMCPCLPPPPTLQGSGLTWLFPLVDGHPPIGWVPALSYLVMPVLLIVSQYASMQLMQPPGQNKDDPAQQQTQAILKFLPLMIGERGQQQGNSSLCIRNLPGCNWCGIVSAAADSGHPQVPPPHDR